MAAAELLVGTDLAAGARVLACAGPGVVEALADRGLRRGRRGARRCGGRRAGTATSTSTASQRAADAVRAGARFVATNLDATYPIPGGLLPGAGSLVAAVATASGREPEVAGKPSAADGRAGPPSPRRPRSRWSATGPPPTVRWPTALGWPFALVLSGVASYTPGPGEEPVPDPPPPFVADDLLALVPSLVATLHPA